MDKSLSLAWPRARRITRRQEYVACYDGGKRYSTKHFVVFVLAHTPECVGRVGLAVTKKCGNAVERNRIKRVLRSFFRLHQKSLPPMDMVVTPKKHLRAESFGLSLAEGEILPLLLELSAPCRGESA